MENLLTLARADAGALGLEMHPLELGAHVRKAQERAKMLSSDKGLNLVLNVPSAPVWEKADAVAVDRRLLILVDNAVEYTPGRRPMRNRTAIWAPSLSDLLVRIVRDLATSPAPAWAWRLPVGLRTCTAERLPRKAGSALARHFGCVSLPW